MSYNVPEDTLANILGIPFAMSEGNMAIVDVNAPGSGSLGGESTAPDGTFANPYRSIQAAVDDTPAPNLGDLKTLTRVIVIFPGLYDENVTVSQKNIMVFLTVGQVILSGSLPIGPVPPADQRYLIYAVEDSPVPSASLSIMPIDNYPNYIGSTNRFWISGNIIIGGDAGDPLASQRSVELRDVKANALTYGTGAGSVGDPSYVPKLEGIISISLNHCEFDAGMNLPDDIVQYRLILERLKSKVVDVPAGAGSVGSTSSSVRLIDCEITEHVACPEATWDICRNTTIGDSTQAYAVSEMWTYGRISNSYFGNGLTIHDSGIPLDGLFADTNIYGQITASANVMRLDPSTNYYVNNNAMIGAGVRTLIHDEAV